MFAIEERMATATDVRRSAARGPRSSECPGECADQRPELAAHWPCASGGRVPCCAKMRLAIGPIAQTWSEARWAHHPRVPVRHRPRAPTATASSDVDSRLTQIFLNV